MRTNIQMIMNIPMGFRFSRTEEELIIYLLRRVMGLQLNHGGGEHQHILERHLYGEKADPWHVFKDVDDSLWDGGIYVITKLSKISDGKTRIARSAGCGTWSGQTPPKKIFDKSGQWVGSKRILSFQRSGDRVRNPLDRHHWIMHEYFLDGVYASKHHHRQIIHQDYVICRIIRVLSIKKRSSSQLVDGDTCCVKKQKKAISRSSPDHQFLDAQIMLPDSTHDSDSIATGLKKISIY